MIRIYVMGRLVIEVERVVDESSLPGTLGRMVLAILATEPGPVSRAKVADLLWDGQPPPAYEPSLRALLSKLRAATVEAGGRRDLISSGPGSVELRRAADVWIDTEEATMRLDAAEGALRHGRHREAWIGAAVASSILNRAFLPGVESPWVEERRRQFGHQLVRAREVTVDAWLGLNEPRQAVVAAERLVEADPYRETSHERLIQAHLGVGNRAAALRAFSQLEARLREELGVAPSASVQAIYERALSD